PLHRTCHESLLAFPSVLRAHLSFSAIPPAERCRPTAQKTAPRNGYRSQSSSSPQQNSHSLSNSPIPLIVSGDVGLSPIWREHHCQQDSTRLLLSGNTFTSKIGTRSQLMFN